MNNNNCNTCNNCIADILKVILILQESANGDNLCLDTCDRGFLGQQCPPINYNYSYICYYIKRSSII